MRDYNAILELAKEKAQSEAQEKGLTHDYAGKLHADSMPVDKIAKYKS